VEEAPPRIAADEVVLTVRAPDAPGSTSYDERVFGVVVARDREPPGWQGHATRDPCVRALWPADVSEKEIDATIARARAVADTLERRASPAMAAVLAEQVDRAASLRSAIAREAARSVSVAPPALASSPGSYLLTHDLDAFSAIAAHEERRARAHGLRLCVLRIESEASPDRLALLRPFDVVFVPLEGAGGAALLPEADAAVVSSLVASGAATVVAFCPGDVPAEVCVRHATTRPPPR
jgi:hypothetical protein